jgi:predicted metal-dependent hydrolase
MMRRVTTGFASLALYSAVKLFMQDKRKSLPKVGGNIFGIYLLAKMLIQLLPEYLAYYKKDFHPAEIDYGKVVQYWKERLAEDYQLESFQ